MKILVTGAAGFIGLHLVKKLLESGHEVVGYDNINNSTSPQLKFDRLAETGIKSGANIPINTLVPSTVFRDYQFVKADLLDEIFLEKLFLSEKFEIVINLAAQTGVRKSITNPKDYLKNNIDGFLNILECCKIHPVKHLIYASSSSVYGNNQKIPFSVTDKVDEPVSIYAATKKSNELMAHTYSHLFKIPTTGLRFFTVYGPWGRPNMAPSLFAEAIINKRPIKVFNHGDMKRDFTYVEDIVEGISRLCLNPPIGSDSKPAYVIHNIGNSSPIKLIDFIEELEKNLNTKSVKEFLPMQLGDVKTTFADIESLQKAIDYAPNTSLETGIKQFADWFIEYQSNI
jgi:UDP-glucuronate 4-epimerase